MNKREDIAIRIAKHFGLLDEYITARLNGYSINDSLEDWDLPTPEKWVNEQMNDEQNERYLCRRNR